MKKLVLIFYFVFYIFHNGFSQNPLVKQWDKRFGGKVSDALTCFQQTAEGGYILGGYSYSGIGGDKTESTRGAIDYWIVKIDSAGSKQWDKTFGGTADDFLHSLQQTADGGYILGGYSSSDSSGDKTQDSRGSDDYWVVKIDSSGIKEWDKRFGGTHGDYFFSLRQTSDGGYILGGYSYSGIGGDKTEINWDISQNSADCWIVKIDSLGVKQWDKDFGGTSSESLGALQQTVDGGYILGGLSGSVISGNKTEALKGGCDYWIVKTDSSGTKQWDRDLGGTDLDKLFSLQQTADGGYILGGYSNSGIGGDKTQPTWNNSYDYWMVKLDLFGAKQWDKDFGGTGKEENFGIISQTADGGYLLAGASNSSISGDKTEDNLGSLQTWIIKTDSTGIKQWDKTTLTSGQDNQGLAIQTKDGCYTAANFTHSGIGGDKTQSNWDTIIPITNDYWIIKFCDSTATTAINNLQSSTSNFQIFPNPANDFINISFTSAEEKNVSVEIFDLLGREVLNKKLQTSNFKPQTQIDISDFENGIYIVELNARDKIYRAKVVKH